jgi:hypothetical protein
MGFAERAVCGLKLDVWRIRQKYLRPRTLSIHRLPPLLPKGMKGRATIKNDDLGGLTPYPS